jgi:two-component system OmpR family sensor kinase
MTDGQAGSEIDTSAWQQMAVLSRELAAVSAQAMEEMLRMPNAQELLARLLYVVTALPLVVADAQKASAAMRVRHLEELVELKSAFMRMTTHELRRPLGIANGYVSMMQDGTFGPSPEPFQEAVQKIGAGVREMASLVDSLATIARLEDRADALLRRTCRLGHLVAEAGTIARLDADAKDIVIDERLPEPDIMVSVDRDRLRIAVLNLMGNAVKHSPPATTVTVEVWAEAAHAFIRVDDEGPGIDPADAEQVFEPWYRAPGISAPGLGLGLYVVRQVVELHGGRVTLERRPNKGTTATIAIPR